MTNYEDVPVHGRFSPVIFFTSTTAISSHFITLKFGMEHGKVHKKEIKKIKL